MFTTDNNKHSINPRDQPLNTRGGTVGNTICVFIQKWIKAIIPAIVSVWDHELAWLGADFHLGPLS